MSKYYLSDDIRNYLENLFTDNCTQMPYCQECKHLKKFPDRPNEPGGLECDAGWENCPEIWGAFEQIDDEL